MKSELRGFASQPFRVSAPPREIPLSLRLETEVKTRTLQNAVPRPGPPFSEALPRQHPRRWKAELEFGILRFVVLHDFHWSAFWESLYSRPDLPTNFPKEP